MARIGFFAGTFDPVHSGHIAFSLSAAQAAELDQVVLLPEPEPRGKQCTPLAHRAAMLNLVAAGNPRLAVLQLEGKQFVVARTLPQLRAQFPKDELFLLLGSDVALGLAHWPALSALLDEMQVIVGVRSHHDRQAVQARLAQIPGLRAQFAESPQAQAASSHIRQGSADHALPEVVQYISQHRLYSPAP